MLTTSQQSMQNKLTLLLAGVTLALTSVALPAPAQTTQEFGWLSEEVKGNQQSANEFCRWWYNKYVNEGTLPGGARNIRANLSSGRCLFDY
jgi:hypothetical protein